MKSQTPPVPLTNPQFPYVPAARTDVQATWRKFGWTPLAENKPKEKQQ